MTTSDDRVFIWTWLPGAAEPVVAGAIRVGRGESDFTYGRSYLARDDAISIGPDLPLGSGWQRPAGGLMLAGTLRDAMPDAWGQRVIEARVGTTGQLLPVATYMLESGSNRFGAIDFQASSTEYVPRVDAATLDELHSAAARVDEGIPLTPAMHAALIHGTSIGGARPKVLVTDESGEQWIAKLSSTSDVAFRVVNAEAAALWLARKAGIETPDVRVTRSLGRDVLLVRRFDRPPGGRRLHCVSALTLVGLDEMQARYATYPMLLDVLREKAAQPASIGVDLFTRIVFNIAIGNSDDHARNHAAFWDGRLLRLTPAYDLAPGPRSGEISSQAMAIGRGGERSSQFVTCLAAAGEYGLSRAQAREVIDRVVATIDEGWSEAADFARLTEGDRLHLWGRQFLNPFAGYGY